MSTHLRSKHKKFAEVDTSLSTLNRDKADRIVQASRDPVDTDRFSVGTIWINTSATNLFIRFPKPNNWRKITTAAA